MTITKTKQEKDTDFLNFIGASQTGFSNFYICQVSQKKYSVANYQNFIKNGNTQYCNIFRHNSNNCHIYM